MTPKVGHPPLRDFHLGDGRLVRRGEAVTPRIISHRTVVISSRAPACLPVRAARRDTSPEVTARLLRSGFPIPCGSTDKKVVGGGFRPHAVGRPGRRDMSGVDTRRYLGRPLPSRRNGNDVNEGFQRRSLSSTYYFPTLSHALPVLSSGPRQVVSDGTFRVCVRSAANLPCQR